MGPILLPQTSKSTLRVTIHCSPARLALLTSWVPNSQVFTPAHLCDISERCIRISPWLIPFSLFILWTFSGHLLYTRHWYCVESDGKFLPLWSFFFLLGKMDMNRYESSTLPLGQTPGLLQTVRALQDIVPACLIAALSHICSRTFLDLTVMAWGNLNYLQLIRHAAVFVA